MLSVIHTFVAEKADSNMREDISMKNTFLQMARSTNILIIIKSSFDEETNF